MRQMGYIITEIIGIVDGQLKNSYICLPKTNIALRFI